MTDALEGGLNCVSCDEPIGDIVELLEHDCDRILTGSDLSQNERSTLLYIEAEMVDGYGILDRERMNYEDEQSIKLFIAADILDLGPIEHRSRDDVIQKVTKFTDSAWQLAAECRKLRGQYNVHEVPECE